MSRIVYVLAGPQRLRFITFFSGVFALALAAFYLMIAGNATAAPMATGTIVDVSVIFPAFNPQVITITAGTTVRWTNNENVLFPHQHTSSSDVTDTLKANYWNSPFLNPGDTFSRTFNTPGVYAYHCNVHIIMHGTVVVLSSVYLPMIMRG